LAARRGDATEFASAFVAMARATGLPARPRAGLVARRTSFYLHVWAEVWLDGWVAVDPFLGQLPADLTHVRLAGPDGTAASHWTPGQIPGIEKLQLRVTVPESVPVAQGS
jgi:transglutaminase-like putative cysteine protease